jgi:SAM-dependent methyltransferase
MERWYTEWQRKSHSSFFDSLHTLDNRNLVRKYESLNDVQLLNGRIDPGRQLTLLEIGCATGEFYRYLHVKYPRVNYYGVDISEPAIERAKEKYPKANFFVNRPNVRVSDTLRKLHISDNPQVVYAKDVIHHQASPFEFLSDLLRIAREALVFRCRTRDIGQTEIDPEHSCQYLYGGWAPYIVVNLEELVGYITRQAPRCEVVVLRNHMILGGQYSRFLPKECYLPETGTAETAIVVLKNGDHPDRVTIQDRTEEKPSYTLDYRLRCVLRRALILVRRLSIDEG